MAKCIESYNQEEDERNGECVSNLDLSLSPINLLWHIAKASGLATKS